MLPSQYYTVTILISDSLAISVVDLISLSSTLRATYPRHIFKMAITDYGSIGREVTDDSDVEADQRKREEEDRRRRNSNQSNQSDNSERIRILSDSGNDRHITTGFSSRYSAGL